MLLLSVSPAAISMSFLLSQTSTSSNFPPFVLKRINLWKYVKRDKIEEGGEKRLSRKYYFDK